MPTIICNQPTDENFDTFVKVRIIKANELAPFNHLSSKQDVINALNPVSDNSTKPVYVEAEYLFLNLLPEKINVSSKTNINSSNKSYNHKIALPVTPQTETIQTSLEDFNNELVVALVYKKNFAHLYGSSQHPLLFTYSDLNNTSPGALQGFNISAIGETYGPAIYFSTEEQDGESTLPLLALTLDSEL